MIYYKKHVFPDGSMMDEHRWVMEQHLGRSLLPTEIVHHKDGDRRNNSLVNLELTNRRDHARHHLKGKTGHACTSEMKAALSRAHTGESNWGAKLSNAAVVDIRTRKASGESYKSIAASYGVSHSTVSRAGRGINWDHV